jgi:hypothetical protein
MGSGKGIWVRYLAALGAAVAAWLIFAFAGLALWLQPGSEARWVAALYRQKEDIARTISSPKILVAGGSSALFGIEAAGIEESTGIPAVNFSTHAGLGLPYLLHRGARVLRSGDLLLLSIEYPLLVQDSRPRPLLVEFTVFFDRPYIHALEPHAWLDFYLGFDYLAANIDGVKRLFGVSGAVEDVYRDDTLNGHGDQTANTLAASTPDRHRRVLSAALIGMDVATDGLAVRHLAATVASLRNRGVGVVMVWPGLVDRPAYRTHAYAAYFERLTREFEAVGAVVLGRPQDSLLPIEDMFDTHFHPNARGRARLTQQLVARLQAAGLIVCNRPLTEASDDSTETARCTIGPPRDTVEAGADAPPY